MVPLLQAPLLQVRVAVPDNRYPVLHLKVATEPCWRALKVPAGSEYETAPFARVGAGGQSIAETIIDGF